MKTGLAILACGLVLIAAEAALAFVGTPIVLVAALLALTGIIARELWDERRT